MPISMEIPLQFAERVLAGSLVRFGCILKDKATGRIVGHLVELAPFSAPVSAFPLGGVVELANAAVNIGQWVDTHHQLKAIQAVLSRLELISSVGALASVAGIGVSVAGFALVMRRLNRLEHNLNTGMEKIRQEVEKIKFADGDVGDGRAQGGMGEPEHGGCDKSPGANARDPSRLRPDVSKIPPILLFAH